MDSNRTRRVFSILARWLDDGGLDDVRNEIDVLIEQARVRSSAEAVRGKLESEVRSLKLEKRRLTRIRKSNAESIQKLKTENSELWDQASNESSKCASEVTRRERAERKLESLRGAEEHRQRLLLQHEADVETLRLSEGRRAEAENQERLARERYTALSEFHESMKEKA